MMNTVAESPPDKKVFKSGSDLSPHDAATGDYPTPSGNPETSHTTPSKKKAIYHMLAKMERGGSNNKAPVGKTLSHMESSQHIKEHKHNEEAYSLSSDVTSELRKHLSTVQRNTAFFKKEGNVHDHYIRHFGDAKDSSGDTKKIWPGDESDASTEYSKVEEPLTLEKEDVTHEDVKDADEITGPTRIAQGQEESNVGHIHAIAYKVHDRIPSVQFEEISRASRVEEKVCPRHGAFKNPALIDVTASKAMPPAGADASYTYSEEVPTKNEIPATIGTEGFVNMGKGSEIPKAVKKVEEPPNYVTAAANEVAAPQVEGFNTLLTEAVMKAESPKFKAVAEEAIPERVESIKEPKRQLGKRDSREDPGYQDASDDAEPSASDESSSGYLESKDAEVLPISGSQNKSNGGSMWRPAASMQASKTTHEVTKEETPEPISTWYMSADKNILAVGSTTGSLKVFMLDLYAPPSNLKIIRGLKEQETIIKPDAMLWGTIATSPTISRNAHLGCINSIHVENRDDDIEVATIVTTGQDCCLKLWKLCVQQHEMSIKLIAATQLLDIPVSAIPIRNTQIMVAFGEGNLVMHNIDVTVHNNAKGCKRPFISASEDVMDEECNIKAVEVSRTGRFIAVCSDKGLLILHETYDMNIIGWTDCKSIKGCKPVGKKAMGVSWNKKENLMLVTAADSSIRIVCTQKQETEHLLQLEAFKGHKNNKMRLKAQFAGPAESYVISFCEKSFIYIWKHHILSKNIQHGMTPIVETNWSPVRFKFDAPKIMPHLYVFNPGEWDHIKAFITRQRVTNTSVTKMPDSRFRCLPCAKNYTHAQSIDVKESNTNNHILLMAADNDSLLRYTLISTDLLSESF